MISTGWVLVTKSNGDVVANVNTETGPDIPPAVSTKMPAMNNATLIAAAPEMLEALENCLGFVVAHPQLTEDLRNLIAKARGES